MTKTEFKQELARVFDDTLHTKQWHNYVDYAIIGFILISTIEIFISTFTVSLTVEKWLKRIDFITQVFFTGEVSLRIWAADALDPKYKGFWGRVRYCCSFYGIIDVLATYPFWLNYIYILGFPVSAMKALRTFRLFRVARMLRIFRYMKAFRFLTLAVRSKKTEMKVSLNLLLVVTVVLSLLLYLVEHEANPEMISNGWESFVWAFAKYIGDPGKVADLPIVTTAGKIISFCVGIMGIAIFAVPIGLIGSGFTEAIDQQKEEEKIEQNIEKLHTAFERKADRLTGYQIVPMFLSIADIQARMEMSEAEIFDAVRTCNEFRVFNIASTIPVEKNPFDKLAIEHYPVNKPYGYMIDRESRVTIVSPSSMADAMVGNFAYYLAKIGGFNYISRELGASIPYKSFYLAKDFDSPGQKEFMEDMNFLTSRRGAWTFTILAAAGAVEPDYPEWLHIGYGGPKGDSSFDAPNLFVHDFKKADAIFTDLEQSMMEKYSIKSERQLRYRFDNEFIYVRYLNHPERINSVIFRIAWSAFAWNPQRIMIAETMANIIKQHLDPGRPLDTSELKIKAIGFSDYKS